ncbi:hypothetical protein B0A55_00501 [Friedmanniomyces simplex]|uniref:Glycoprotease family protein n=1 Tax=Friedmanniomyces simplex TaxID=329884 RepID=A0A4U0Y2A3_9PEZI|nr:hypothetical protein B0A55_00501 [Friedmanniomyces simplex]
MLDEPSDMGTVDHHAGVIFTNRALEDDELRSALPPDTGSVRPAVPKRSDTAPGALDIGAAPVNIYRVPSQGLAAAYYNADRHFLSLVLEGIGSGDMRGVLNGWSPSQSVAHPDVDVREIGNTAGEGLESGHLAEEDMAGECVLSDADQVASPEHETRGIDGTAKEDEGPFADANETESKAFDNHGPRNVFKTPFEEELQGPSAVRPTTVRNDTNATLLSTFSPLTPTPIVEDAHMATYMGPQSSNGELREVLLTPARTRSPHDAATAAASARYGLVEAPPHDRGMESMSEKAPYRPSLHTRTDSSGSRGLGITDGEKELYPPPKTFVTQPRLGTDRFGQLTIRGVEEDERPYVPWYRRMLFPLLFAGGPLLLALIVLLVMLVPQAHNDMAVEAEWLNLTGFPPLPTGVATVIQPKAVKEVSGCVKPDSLWSCAMPSDQAKDASAGGGPDFRFEIRFKNGTILKNETQLARRSAAVTAQASKLVRRDGWADLLLAADPAVPSKNDQQFLGQYTDNITLPYEGKQTPFYISLLDPSALTGQGSNMMKRQINPYPYPQLTNTTTDATTTAGKTIPRPALHADGKPAGPVLYPYAEFQPLRLFNRGRNDEHYGFYIYFDRSLFVSNLALNASASNGLSNTVVSDSIPLNNASAVCTFSQTRLQIQIWTRQATVSSLGHPIPLKGLPAINATANDMAAPGSFPYPVTVTLDRHGGQAKQKGVYCYGLSEDKVVLESVKMWVDEDRGSGGDVVNAAAVPGSNGTALLGKRDGENHGYGGVDGGDGGCACQWRN